MTRKRTMPLVNVAFIAMIAVVALTSAATFIWLTDIVDRSMRTAALARDLVEAYRRLEASGPGTEGAQEAEARYAALGGKSEELATNVATTSRRSTRAMACVVLSSFGTVVAGAGLMLLMERRIGRPLGLMLRATERISAGDFDHQVGYEANDEMGALAQSLDRMARCLRRSLDQVVQQKLVLRTRVKQATADLRAQSLSDELTGLPNLRHLRQAFDEAASDAPDAGAGLLLAVLGIDDFKVFNDSFGYDAGNVVLVAFARSVQAAARPGDFVARGSGVQFIVLIAGLETVPEAFVRDVQASLGAIGRLLHHRTGKAADITVGVGEAHFPEDGTALPELLSVAERHLAANARRIEMPSRERAGTCAEEPV